ncbi:MAG: hypothetical protein ACPLRW_07480 [Moorellales bacterium]
MFFEVVVVRRQAAAEEQAVREEGGWEPWWVFAGRLARRNPAAAYAAETAAWMALGALLLAGPGAYVFAWGMELLGLSGAELPAAPLWERALLGVLWGAFAAAEFLLPKGCV